MTQLELKGAINGGGRIHTPWSGAVRMRDGIDYHGNVWSWRGRLYIFYRDQPYQVRWDKDHYVLA